MQRRTDATAIADRRAPAARTRGLRALLAALTLSTIAVPLSGCGSSHTTGTSADPASVTPISAPLYASAIVRPEGSLKSSAHAAAETLTHQTDPYLRLLQVLQTPGSQTLDFERDVAPWLGPRAGVFLSSLGSAEESSVGRLLTVLGQALLSGSSTTSAFPFGVHSGAAGASGGQGAIVLDTTNVARARSFLDSQAKRAGAHPASYRNVSYQVSSGDVAFGIVDRLAVIGSESGMRSVIDTTLGGPALLQSPSYSRLLAAAPSGALAHLYANPAAAGGAHGSSGGSAGSAGSGASGLATALAGTRPINVSVVPTANSITLDADSVSASAPATERTASGPRPAPAPQTQAGAARLFSSLFEGATALGELPGESWLALGLGDVGATLGADVRGLRALVSLGGSLAGSGSEGPSGGGLSVKGLLEGILTPLNALGANTAQARTDFQSWMTSAGIFASGTGLLELRAGVSIGSNNPTLSRSAVGKLGEQLRRSGATVTPVSIAGTDASVAAKLPGLPVELYIADGRNPSGQSRFVIGLGELSVTDALNPPSTLAGSATLAGASAVLGEGTQPNVIVNVTTLLGLLEAIGLTANPPVSKLVPYLRAVPTVVGGGRSMGEGIERYRLVLKLQKTG